MIRFIKLIIFILIGIIIYSLFPSSIGQIEKIIDKYSNKAWAATAYYKLGSYAYHLLKFDEALRIYKKALRKDPHNPSSPVAMFRIGVCYEKEEKYGEAIREYRKFIREYPNYPLNAQARNKIKKLKEIKRNQRIPSKYLLAMSRAH